MKYLLILLIIIFMKGCLYFNDRGISGKLYSECKESYDAHGNYIKECDKNIADYTEIKDDNKKNARSEITIDILATEDNRQCQQNGIKIDTGCSSR